MMTTSDRASQPGVATPLPTLTPEQIALREVENGLRQFDRVAELVREATSSGASHFRLRPSVVMELNRIAVSGLQAAPGSYRQTPISITGTQHVPPEAADVPSYVDEMCDYIEARWPTSSAVHLCAYILWRLNWIHPFTDGNGRTSRAVGYLVLCARLGYFLPGIETIPDLIAGNKQPYYDALDAADAADHAGVLDVGKMEDLVEGLLAKQLVGVFEDAKSS